MVGMHSELVRQVQPYLSELKVPRAWHHSNTYGPNRKALKDWTTR